eukprot:1318468-Amorphochlora_amoeboformis.AAC.1
MYYHLLSPEYRAITLLPVWANISPPMGLLEGFWNPGVPPESGKPESKVFSLRVGVRFQAPACPGWLLRRFVKLTRGK